MPLSKSNYLPKPSLPNIITMSVKISIYEIWGNTNIQSIAGIFPSEAERERSQHKGKQTTSGRDRDSPEYFVSAPDPACLNEDIFYYTMRN